MKHNSYFISCPSIIFSIFLTIVILLTVSCTEFHYEKPPDKLKNVYLSFAGERDGFKIYIVDGDEIRKNYFDEFVYGGNGERYTFIPHGEIWVDNSISAEEFETTVAHELKERKLMAQDGLSYDDAHDSALALEVRLRNEWKDICLGHEEMLDSVTPRDFDSTMEIDSLPEKIKLKNIYRIPLGNKDGVKIWVVDGYLIRREIFPDFGFSGNDMEYMFIPPGEIWIDGQISCLETNYSIAQELKERELMKEGQSYDSAYIHSMSLKTELVAENEKLISHLPEVKKTNPAFRDEGTKTEDKKK